MNKHGETNYALLSQIHEGMDVYDADEDKVGTVSFVRMTDEDPTQPGPETAAASNVDEPYRDSLVHNIAEAFVDDDDLPQEMRRRLLREGYIRVDTGILKSDRFITPDQISRVSDETVYLSVRDEDIIRS